MELLRKRDNPEYEVTSQIMLISKWINIFNSPAMHIYCLDFEK